MRWVLIVVVMFSSLSVVSQSFDVGSLVAPSSASQNLNGIVLDKENNKEPLAFATITVKETGESVLSEIDGSFSFQLKPGTYTLVYSFIGYQNLERIIDVESDSSTSHTEILKATKLNTDALAVVSNYLD